MKGGVVPWSKAFLQDIFFQLRKLREDTRTQLFEG